MTDLIEKMVRVHFAPEKTGMELDRVQRHYKHLIDEYEAKTLRFLREAEEAGYVLRRVTPTLECDEP